jgi:hypothetical protein
MFAYSSMPKSSHRYKVFSGKHRFKGGSIDMNTTEKMDPKIFEVQPFDPAKSYGTAFVNGNKDYSYGSSGGSIDHIDFSYNKHRGRKNNAKLQI